VRRGVASAEQAAAAEQAVKEVEVEEKVVEDEGKASPLQKLWPGRRTSAQRWRRGRLCKPRVLLQRVAETEPCSPDEKAGERTEPKRRKSRLAQRRRGPGHPHRRGRLQVGVRDRPHGSLLGVLGRQVGPGQPCEHGMRVRSDPVPVPDPPAWRDQAEEAEEAEAEEAEAEEPSSAAAPAHPAAPLVLRPFPLEYGYGPFATSDTAHCRLWHGASWVGRWTPSALAQGGASEYTHARSREREQRMHQSATHLRTQGAGERE
jgi:hypothetical protein